MQVSSPVQLLKGGWPRGEAKCPPSLDFVKMTAFLRSRVMSLHGLLNPVC